MIYIALFMMIGLVGITMKPENQRGALIGVLLLLLPFMGWREFVGCDFVAYGGRFYRISLNADPFLAFAESEPGFQFLTTLIRVSGLHYMWVNIAASAIILWCTYLFLRNFESPVLILAALFPIFIVQLSMSGIRQGIATAMLLAACSAFIRVKRLQVALWILVGTSFHASVAMFLPLALLAGRQLSFLWLAGSIVLLGPSAAWIMSDRFDEYSDRYIDQIYGDVSSGGALFRYAPVLLVALIFIVKRQRFSSLFPKEFPLFQVFNLLALAILPLTVLSTIALHRITFYIMPISAVTFAYAYYCFANPSLRPFLRAAPVIVYGIYLVGWMNLSKHASLCYLPYKSYLL
jgi:hypothetical protein